MLYNCTNMATLGVKRIKVSEQNYQQKPEEPTTSTRDNHHS